MRRALALAAVIALLPVLPAGATFIDDDGRPGEKALEWLAVRGVIDGCNPPHDDAACPARVLTRAEAAKILVKLGRDQGRFGDRRPGTGDHFVDDDDTWGGAAEPLISHLADLGVVHGCNPPANTRFCPDERLRRGQIVKMVVRAFDLEAPAEYRSPWTDTQGRFYGEAARIAAYHDLVDASAGILAGEEEVTRDEFARMVVAVFAPDLCRENPFPASRVAGIERDHPGIQFTAHVIDLDSGCAYGFNSDHRQETASVFKVMVMAGTLLEAQNGGRQPSGWERSQLETMIRQSANEPVRNLWRSFGGSPWFRDQARLFAMGETRVQGDDGGVWGRTTTSAYDQAQLLRQVLLDAPGPLEAVGRRTALELMAGVVESQTWGVTAGVPAAWTVAQKNGFAGLTTNSVGVIYDPEMEPDYVLAILSFGWSDWRSGVESVEEIAAWAAESLVD
ncbi:MAG TPA: serine hydrolase [Acidimicrobiia bacterium]|nr:serine hydrolase [Acidimicrobiia bacterium]